MKAVALIYPERFALMQLEDEISKITTDASNLFAQYEKAFSSKQHQPE